MHKKLERISPLAVPVMLEIGKENIASDDTHEELMAEVSMGEEDLVREAMGTVF